MKWNYQSLNWLNIIKLEITQGCNCLIICIIFASGQTLKNALSPYKIGGAAGGSDFDPKGKSDNEVKYLLQYMKVFTLECS